MNLEVRNERCRVEQKPWLPNGLELRQRDERLQAMKGLVATLAHSFNNTLAPIAGYTALLAEELPPKGPCKDYLARCETSLHRAQGLIEAIQQATHPERDLVVQTVDFGRLLQQTTGSWKNGLPAASQIMASVEVVPCFLALDERQWGKATEHLLRNAEAALGLSGAVQLILSRETLTHEEAAELGMDATDVFLLRVEDTGCGMSPEVLDHACDPLFTTRPRGPVGGLGLTFVHGLVRMQGGQIAIESSEGAGTRVLIWLPADLTAS
jgi:signal transduction histidine kinase